MAKASNNEFPSVLFEDRSTDPSTPSASTARLFVKDDSGAGLYLIDDAGTVTGPFVDASSAPDTDTQRKVYAVGFYGDLETGTGVNRIPMIQAGTIEAVRVMVNTAPTGADAIFDVNKNGTTIYTTQGNRPTITAAGTDSGAGSAPDVTSVAAGDYLTVDVDQIGSTVAGADGVLIIEVSV